MGGWRHSLTSYSQPPPHSTPVFFLTSISRKKGLVLFLNHRKNLLQLRRNFITTNLSDLQMTQWCCFGIFLKVSLCKTRTFTWCTMWSHHLPRNNIAERHGTKRTLKQTILNSRIPSIMALLDSFFLTMKSDRLKCQVHPVGDVRNASPFLLGLPWHLASRTRSSEKRQCPEGTDVSLMWRAFKGGSTCY